MAGRRLMGLLLAAGAAGYHNQSVVDRVNSGRWGWTAGANPHWRGYSIQAVRLAASGTPGRAAQSAPGESWLSSFDFDARRRWPDCTSIGVVHDQGQCGSCWAFGCTTAFTDRLCIAHDGRFNPELSVEATVSCVAANNGCRGGRNSNGWDYFHTHGVPTSECMPYEPKPCPAPGYGHNPCWGPPLPGSKAEHPTPNCSDRCVDGSVPRRFHTNGSHYELTTDADIMIDLVMHGPVTACFDVFDDFLHYTGGVYRRTPNTTEMGGHCVKLIGWGHENSTNQSIPYWLAINEWSESWGEQGLFRILRGANGANFPSQVAAGYPHVSL